MKADNITAERAATSLHRLANMRRQHLALLARARRGAPQSTWDGLADEFREDLAVLAHLIAQLQQGDH